MAIGSDRWLMAEKYGRLYPGDRVVKAADDAVTAVVLLLTAGVVRPVWVLPAWITKIGRTAGRACNATDDADAFLVGNAGTVVMATRHRRLSLRRSPTT